MRKLRLLSFVALLFSIVWQLGGDQVLASGWIAGGCGLVELQDRTCYPSDDPAPLAAVQAVCNSEPACNVNCYDVNYGTSCDKIESPYPVQWGWRVDGCPSGYRWYECGCQCVTQQTMCVQYSYQPGGGNWVDGFCYPPDPPPDTPLLMDLRSADGNYDLTSPEDGVWFDLEARGTPQRVAWTARNTAVGFIVRDLNGNGRIDDGSELFGSATVLSSGRRAANGFEALADLDGVGGTPDGRIDSADVVFGELRLWVDRDHDGISTEDELLTLDAAKVTTLFTSYRETRRVDRHGNQYRYKGMALMAKHGDEVVRKLFDVILAVAR